ncbi:MAG: hypothetical protein ACLUKO_10000 [Enterocloster bolteae]
MTAGRDGNLYINPAATAPWQRQAPATLTGIIAGLIAIARRKRRLPVWGISSRTGRDAAASKSGAHSLLASNWRMPWAVMPRWDGQGVRLGVLPV